MHLPADALKLSPYEFVCSRDKSAVEVKLECPDLVQKERKNSWELFQKLLIDVDQQPGRRRLRLIGTHHIELELT